MENHKESNDWTDRTILVTGANKGIGYAAVENLLKAGKYSKIIITSRSQQAAEEAIKLIAVNHDEENAIKVSFIVLDLNETSSINNFINEVKEKYGQVDTLLNNAAMLTDGPNCLELYDKDFFINYIQTKYLMVKFLQEKALKRNGKIIVTSSRLASLKVMKEANPYFTRRLQSTRNSALRI